MASDSAASGARVVSVAALAAAVGAGTSRHGAFTSSKSHTTTPSELLQVLLGICGTPTTASWLVAAGVNAAVLGYVSYKLYRNAVVQQDKYKQLKRSAQRLWRLATQGGDAAGMVPEDLGEPDASGVYSLDTATGTLYFRQTKPQPFAAPHWEWSTDRVLWIPTSYADSLWYSTESTPSTADKVLIRRLEIEGQLLARQQGSSSSAAAAGAMLPPLDLSQSNRDLSCLMDVPTAFLCPISMSLMTQPVVTPSGATFDRAALLDWIRQTHTDPLSGQPLSSDQLVPNLVLRDMIHAWLLEDPAAAAVSTQTASNEATLLVTRAGEGLAALECVNGGSKADRDALGAKDAVSTAKEALTPGTPVRASRDV